MSAELGFLRHQRAVLLAALRGLVYVVEAMDADRPVADFDPPDTADVQTALDMADAAIRAAVPQEPAK